jgi:2-hydroxychromene-2-carboxylate isomerase
MTEIRFLFDYVSPYAFLAWKRLHRAAAREPIVLRPEPVLFAGLLNAHGQLGPAEIPAKRRYIFRDVLRTALREGIPLAPPRTHPYNPLLALRLSGLDMDPAARIRLVDRLFDRAWSEGGGVETPDDLSPVLDALGLDAPALLSAAGSTEAKERLKVATARAVEAGVFGVPTMFVGEEMYWGNDAIDHVLDAIAGRSRPLPAELLDRWEHLPASAHRR